MLFTNIVPKVRISKFESIDFAKAKAVFEEVLYT